MVSTEKSSLATTPIKHAAPNPTKPAAQAVVTAVAPATPATPVAKPATKPGVKKAPAKAPVKKAGKTVVKASARKTVTTAAKSAPAAGAQGIAKVPTPNAVKPKTVKPAKEKKPKLVRDSFTIPKVEYGVLDELKQRAAKLASPAKKSELLRAGIKALAAMPDVTFLAALKAVPAIKTGRPAKD
jgi:hypothetical protein